MGFVLAAAGRLDEVDTLCHIMPLLDKFLKHLIITLNDQVL